MKGKSVKIGLISDTHGFAASIIGAVNAIPDADAWIHLGDLTSDADYLRRLTGVPVCSVSGNCDMSAENTEAVFTFENVRIFACHGHKYGVKYDNLRIKYRAEELGCSVAVYGHTHIPCIEMCGEILIINPGSPSLPRGGMNKTVCLLTVNGRDVVPRFINISK